MEKNDLKIEKKGSDVPGALPEHIGHITQFNKVHLKRDSK
jgi:hypothetical protein